MPSVLQGLSHAAKEFGSADPNLVLITAALDQHESQKESPMLDVEGLQRLGDTSSPNPVDEPMHDAHAEVGIRQAPDTKRL